MQTALPTDGLEKYKSKPQLVRVATEEWGEKNLYCASCTSPRLADTPTNTRAIDFTCKNCESRYQLKSQGRPLRGRILGASYSAMCREILEDSAPSLLALQYRPIEWSVENLILIPHFAFPVSAIKERPPLAPHARQKGWVGYYILFDSFPPDARIPVVLNGVPRAPREVRAQYQRIRPLERLEPKQRGWTLDVLNVLRALGKTEFDLADVYAHEEHLADLHPDNQHVRDKIRQQLQVLRDMGLVEFRGNGKYRMT